MRIDPQHTFPLTAHSKVIVINQYSVKDGHTPVESKVKVTYFYHPVFETMLIDRHKLFLSQPAPQ